MSFFIGPRGQAGLQAAAQKEYQDFAQANSNHPHLAAAAQHRQQAALLARKGAGAQAAQHLAVADTMEKQNTAMVNRKFIEQSIAKLRDRFSNGYRGDDAWAHASFQARMKVAFADFRATGGTDGEFQQRVLDGIQNPYFRMAVLGHPGLA